MILFLGQQISPSTNLLIVPVIFNQSSNITDAIRSILLANLATKVLKSRFFNNFKLNLKTKNIYDMYLLVIYY